MIAEGSNEEPNDLYATARMAREKGQSKKEHQYVLLVTSETLSSTDENTAHTSFLTFRQLVALRCVWIITAYLTFFGRCYPASRGNKTMSTHRGNNVLDVRKGKLDKETH